MLSALKAAIALVLCSFPIGMTLHIHTPLIRSVRISELLGVNIFLKLELLQPSGSFKDRGMGHMCRNMKENGKTKLISSSGGNAGHSAAYAGRNLGMDVKVIVPSTTKQRMLDLIRAQGAEVEVYGENWNDADARARELTRADNTAAYISPYDHPLLWEGHSSLVDELRADGIRPDAIVASVGGGGLLCGIYEGLERNNWTEVTIIAVETEGAASFKASFDAKQITRIKQIESVATSLGALEVTPTALEYSRRFETLAEVVSDRSAVDACCQFLDDHRMLVEPACGAALAMAYSAEKRHTLQKYSTVVIVVCGGCGVTADYLNEWKQTFQLS